MSSSDTVTYLFALCAARPPDEALSAVAGHSGGGPLRALRAGAVHLIVQDVPAADFDERTLADRLNRPGDLRRCALAHHRGVAAGAPCGPVVPLPMATVYLSDDNAVAAVAAREEAVLAVFRRLTGRTEWAVKVHAAPGEPAGSPAPPAAARAAPGGTGTGGTGDSGGSGAAGGRSYLSRASARQRSRRDLHETARAVARTVDLTLRRYAVDATAHRPQSERLTGRRAPQLLNAAYLVDDARHREFTAALERLRADERLREVEITSSGPWIPYSFARLDEPEAMAVATPEATAGVTAGAGVAGVPKTGAP
ncbi:GvpL/GvpF family gas vesicle protein [Streptomyces abyssomicinicus]|uniref:GvpL/GvpF family gas vesicle protein n=1 Tax=Streptomyces abyssomicinicus TaxID=574929 RepID=UPI00124F9E1D|nr:GvpL/GvpF family gas vesicle protein [Streptomyces abyssomicinicus]